MSRLYVGLMSGTSLDAADAVLADLSEASPRVLSHAEVPFSAPLRSRLERLCHPGSDGLDDVGACNSELADLYAAAVTTTLQRAGIPASRVKAIGCHGQTVRHRPARGFTLQLGDPARLAEYTSIDVVTDFRRRDMAAGGQGAPLVPAFHDAVFRHGSRARAVVNIGGISNVTRLTPGCPPAGFDCGPGNVLMDAWASRNGVGSFDEDGKWAASGHVDQPILDRMLAEPYLALPAPKSTGRELFNLEWLERRLERPTAAADVQATLLEFTARSIVDAIEREASETADIYLCGGGARNGRLRERISLLANGRRVELTDALGVPTGLVEPVAFAWLAEKFVRREALDLRTITGARHPCVLGALYPA